MPPTLYKQIVGKIKVDARWTPALNWGECYDFNMCSDGLEKPYLQDWIQWSLAWSRVLCLVVLRVKSRYQVLSIPRLRVLYCVKIEQHHQRRKKQPSQLQLGLHETLGQSDVGYESTRSKYTVGGTRSDLNNLYRACSRFQTLHVIAVALDAARFDAINGEHATQDKWGKFNAPQELEGGRLTRTPTPISRTPLFHSLMRNRSFALYCTNFCYINYF